MLVSNGGMFRGLSTAASSQCIAAASHTYGGAGRPAEPCAFLFLCWQVLEGELAQRADATRKLREVQKQLMLLGGLVPPSPVVTAAAAAAARGRRHSNNLLSGPSGDGSGGMADEAVLTQDAKALQDAIDSHTKSIKVRRADG